MINRPADLLDFHPGLRHIRQNGACRNADSPDDWFPTAHGNAECLEWALQNRELGIWGAPTDRQRTKIRRKRGMP